MFDQNNISEDLQARLFQEFSQREKNEDLPKRNFLTASARKIEAALCRVSD